MEASALNLLNAVDNQGGYLGGGDWSKVSKSGLSAKYVRLMEAKILGFTGEAEGFAEETVPRRS